MHPGFAIGVLFALSLGALGLTAPSIVLERLTNGAGLFAVRDCSGRLVSSGSCWLFLRSHGGWLSAGEVSYRWRFESESGPYLALGHDGRPAGTLFPSVDGWVAKEVEVRVPILPLAGFPAQSSGIWRPTGQVTIRLPQLSCKWDGADCAGQSRIGIDNLSAGKSGKPLGSYLVDLMLLPGGGFTGQVTTLAGPLRLAGRFDRSSGNQVRIDVRATPEAGVAEDVSQMLASSGRADGAGGFRFSVSP